MITTPKDVQNGPWGGAESVRLTINLGTRAIEWDTIARATGDLHFETLHRYATNSAKEAPRLTLTIGELSTTLANTPKATHGQIIELWNMSAGANINLIVIDPEVNSAAWGIQDRRDILNNLVFAQVEDGQRWSLGCLDPRPIDFY